MSRLFSWLTVFSLLQAALNFAVWFIHQTSNQMWSLPKQVMWLWGFWTQKDCVTSNCSENITYKIQNSCLSLPCDKMNSFFYFHASLWGRSSSSSEITFSVHLALICMANCNHVWTMFLFCFYQADIQTLTGSFQLQQHLWSNIQFNQIQHFLFAFFLAPFSL